MASKSTDTDRVYPADEIRARLARDLARWTLEGGSICRVYETGGWRATLMLVNAVGHLAEAAFHHPAIELSYAALKVELQTHSAGGVTDKDFELASRIEQLLMWQPGGEPGALEGLPPDPRYQYVEYD